MAEYEKPVSGPPVLAANVDPPHHNMTASEYFKTRISSLKPPMTKTENPFRLLASVTRIQWAFFSVAFLAWVSFFHLCSFGK